MASAFAAVIAARLRSLPIAVGRRAAHGRGGRLVQHYLPPSSSFTARRHPEYPVRDHRGVPRVLHGPPGGVNESEGVGGALDRAIAVQSEMRVPSDTVDAARTSTRSLVGLPSIICVAIVAVLPFFLHGFWIGLLAEGVAFSIIFLSFTLVIGEGGMVWLCMVTFAGVGGLATGQLATNHHWPVLLAVLAGGIIAMPMGVIIGILTIRFGRPVRGPGHPDVRPPDGEPGVQPEHVPQRRASGSTSTGPSSPNRIRPTPTWRWRCSSSSPCSSSTCDGRRPAWP